jgi:hypothetical protein
LRCKVYFRILFLSRTDRTTRRLIGGIVPHIESLSVKTSEVFDLPIHIFEGVLMIQTEMNAVLVGLHSIVYVHHFSGLLERFMLVSAGSNLKLFLRYFLLHDSHHIPQQRLQIIVKLHRTQFKHFFSLAQILFA